MQAEGARRELEVSGCHRLRTEAGEAGTHRLELSEKTLRGIRTGPDTKQTPTLTLTFSLTQAGKGGLTFAKLLGWTWGLQHAPCLKQAGHCGLFHAKPRQD